MPLDRARKLLRDENAPKSTEEAVAQAEYEFDEMEADRQAQLNEEAPDMTGLSESDLATFTDVLRNTINKVSGGQLDTEKMMAGGPWPALKALEALVESGKVKGVEPFSAEEFMSSSDGLREGAAHLHAVAQPEDLPSRSKSPLSNVEAGYEQEDGLPVDALKGPLRNSDPEVRWQQEQRRGVLPVMEKDTDQRSPLSNEEVESRYDSRRFMSDYEQARDDMFPEGSGAEEHYSDQDMRDNANEEARQKARARKLSTGKK